MNSTIIINLPMKSFLKKFLTKKYGSHHKVSRNSLLGIHLIELLDKQYKRDHVKIKETDSFPFHFEKTVVEKMGFNISSGKMQKFEVFLHKLFRSSLDDYITTSINSDLVIKTNKSLYKQDVLNAMKQFLACYEINEDDLKLNSLYRDYSREKKKIGQTVKS
jgi:hypothetical protein